ncbi:MAG: hypothetical protein HPY79_03610 [Bacteroidales bacterium]|nr:hypothetical protein [Bacteroidales bacterium]
MNPTQYVKILTWAIALVLGLFSCKQEKQNLPNDKVIARAFDQYLTQSDVAELLIDAKNKEDSFSIIQTYAQNWAKKKVLLQIAEKNLSAEQLDVSKEVENFKNNLLIYRYQQAYIQEHLDTIVSDYEIEKYYNEHQNELTLNENIVKALLIQIPRSFNQINKLKSIYKSEKAADIQALDVICNKYAYQCNNFNDEWVSFDKVLSYIPINISNQNDFLKNNKTIEVIDSNFAYFVNIKDFKLIGEIMPKEWGAKQVVIPNILIQRKLKLIKELENKSLEDYINKNKVEFYYP